MGEMYQIELDCIWTAATEAAHMACNFEATTETLGTVSLHNSVTWTLNSDSLNDYWKHYCLAAVAPSGLLPCINYLTYYLLLVLCHTDNDYIVDFVDSDAASDRPR